MYWSPKLQGPSKLMVGASSLSKTPMPSGPLRSSRKISRRSKLSATLGSATVSNLRFVRLLQYTAFSLTPLQFQSQALPWAPSWKDGTSNSGKGFKLLFWGSYSRRSNSESELSLSASQSDDIMTKLTRSALLLATRSALKSATPSALTLATVSAFSVTTKPKVTKAQQPTQAVSAVHQYPTAQQPTKAVSAVCRT